MIEFNLSDSINKSAIAIIGMAGRFPGAKNVTEFWQNLRNGVESISFFSDEELRSAGVETSLLNDPNYVKAAPVLPDVENFDASFFGYSARESTIIDPQQRIFLECAWEALENAGYKTTDDYSIGIYGGSGISTYLLNNINNNKEFNAGRLWDSLQYIPVAIGNGTDFLTTRVAYKLNLKGPAVNLQTACSTSLVAVHTACQSLLNGECDIALAGAVSVLVPQKIGYLYQEGLMLSPDGHCRAFDAEGKGTLFGDGVGIVVLKMLTEALADGDYIHAVIKGSAINNDGSFKVSFTAPSVDGQAAVITEAQEVADIDPETITYIEAHGTGTPLGDPIEIAALTQAFRANTEKKGYCAIGSVKTNIGHIVSAAGIAGLIKTVLALKHKQIPPSLNFQKPNPEIDFENSPFYVNTKLTEWERNDSPRRAGVSSFGFGGTNAHVVLEEWSQPPLTPPDQGKKKQQLLLLSAKTPSALDNVTINLANHLKQHPEVHLADVAYTLTVGRTVFNYRRIAVVSDGKDAVNTLNNLAPKQVLTNSGDVKSRSVVFMFSGQGSQYVNMARELYQTEVYFQEQVDQCCELLKSHLDFDLRDILYPNEDQIEIATEKLTQTAITQPALFVIEYALAQLWMHWGIKPVAMIGHSVGEYVAATLAGIFSLEDALSLVTIRGQLMQSMPSGSMLAIPLPEHEVQLLLEGTSLQIATVNSPANCVVSGTTEAVEAFEKQLATKEIEVRRLHTSHAFHSSMMEPILAPFTEKVKQVKLNAPTIPFVSNVTGTWITVEDATNPSYYAQHLRACVRFADGVKQFFDNPDQILLEVGPGRTLSTLAKRHPDQPSEQITLTSVRHPQEEVSDVTFLIKALGQLWLSGTQVNWENYYGEEKHYRVPLPTYPFERKRYWIEAKNPPHHQEINLVPASKEALGKKPDMGDWFYVPAWKPLPLLPSEQNDISAPILVFMDEWGLSSELVKQLITKTKDVLNVQVGEKFAKLDTRLYSINPSNPDDYQTLIQTLAVEKQIPKTIVHLWNVNNRSESQLTVESVENAQNLGFYSLLYLTQALGQQNIENEIAMVVVSNGMQKVNGEETISPEKATLIGPVRVIPQEYSNIHCRSVDVVLPPSESQGEAQLITQLLNELQQKSAAQIIAYRGDRRSVQTFEPLYLEQPSAKIPQFKQGGVYLITGGLGGIGLVFAEHLAKTVQAKLILTGRSALGDRHEWEQWLTNHCEEDPTSIKIRKVQHLEKLGAEVLVVCADVVNQKQMTAAISLAQQQFGQINGVIHAAGIPGGGVIQLKTREIAENVIAPKVKGTVILETLLKHVELDFMVVCSSNESLLGRFGQVDYCAANNFLDAYAQAKSADSNRLTISINWDAWQEVGMAVDTAQQGLEKKTLEVKKLSHPFFQKCIIEKTQQIYVSKLSPSTHWVLGEHQIENFDLGISEPGLLDELAFYPTSRQTPGLGEVEIEVFASGLNFKSVLQAIGMINIKTKETEGGGIIIAGFECAGTIVSIGEDVDGFNIGDEVIAFASSCCSSFVTTPASSVVLKPANLSLEEAATIPVAFQTAYYMLREVGKLRKGESILIHAASGGVGLAAVQIAQMIGVEIFATAGKPEKQEFLKSLGIKYVMDSRSLDFVEQVKEYTNGKGVDVILNSLGGEFMFKSLSLLAPYGRFLELGIQDILENNQLGLKVFEKGITFSALDLEADAPNWRNIFEEVIQHFQDGNLSPIPYKVFPITEVVNAFQYMLQAKHIGKIVLYQNEEIRKKLVFEKPKQSQKLDKNKKRRQEKTNLFLAEIEHGILPQEGVDNLNRILKSRRTQVIISTTGLESRIKDVSLLTQNHSSKETDSVELSDRPHLSQAYEAPQSQIDQIITQVWQEMLGIDKIGMHDNFFDLGGDSLVAVQLIAKLNKKLKVKLSVNSLLNSATIKGLTELVSLSSQASQKELPSCLIKFHSGSDQKKPLFLVHPVGGTAFVFRDLANNLDPEQPVYGIQVPEVDSKPRTFNTIEEMATHYLDAVRTVQPKGPYYIGGMSLGGIIAYEMAQQLTKEGEEIGLLTLFDTPMSGELPTHINSDLEIMAYWLDLDKKSDEGISLKILQNLEPNEQLRYFWERSRIAKSIVPQGDLTMFRNFLDLFISLIRLGNNYVPTTYQGKIIFFVAEEENAVNPYHPEKDWLELAEIVTEEVPGNHMTMMYPPNVEVFAQKLRYYLA